MRPSSPEQPWPLPCHFFSFTPIFDPELVGHTLHGGGINLRQHLLLLWGKQRNAEDTDEINYKGTWLLQFNGGKPDWMKVLFHRLLCPIHITHHLLIHPPADHPRETQGMAHGSGLPPVSQLY